MHRARIIICQEKYNSYNNINYKNNNIKDNNNNNNNNSKNNNNNNNCYCLE